MTIGERVKAVRKSKHMTQKELGDILGISSVNISQIENNVREPKIETLARIASALDVAIDAFLEVKPLPSKSVPISSDIIKEAVLKSEDIEFEAFTNYLDDIGYKLLIDGSKLKSAEDLSSHVWVLYDARNDRCFFASSLDLDELMKSITAYTKFQIYALTEKLPSVSEEEMERYKKVLRHKGRLDHQRKPGAEEDE